MDEGPYKGKRDRVKGGKEEKGEGEGGMLWRSLSFIEGYCGFGRQFKIKRERERETKLSKM